MSAPRELRTRIPQLVASIADRATLAIALVLLGAAFWPFVARHNAWLYLLAAPLGSSVPPLFWTFRPFNPYKTIGARSEGLLASNEDPESVEARFTAAFRTATAKRIIWTTAAIIAALALAIAGTLVLSLRSRPIDWSMKIGDVLACALLFATGSALLEMHMLVRRILQMCSTSTLK